MNATGRRIASTPRDRDGSYDRLGALRAGLVLAAALLSPALTQAADRTVGPGKTYTDLKYALNASAHGDRILIYAGTYTGNFAVNKRVEVIGVDAGVTLTATSGTVVNVYNTASGASFSNLRVINGDGTNGGAVRVSRANASFTSMVFEGNRASGSGGALFCSESNCVVSASTFRNNTTSGSGGGIASYRGTLSVSSSTFVDNASNLKGAGIFVNLSTSATVQDSLFQSNDSGTESGGGICFGDSTNGNILRNDFTGNHAMWMGGGAYFVNSSGTARGNLFEYNDTDADGGGLALQHSTVDAIGNVVRWNQSQLAGGGIYFVSGTGGIARNNVVYGNVSYFAGGGIVVDYGLGDVYNNIVAYNSSLYGGGGVLVGNGSVGVKVFNNTVVANDAGGDFTSGISAISGSDLNTVNNIVVWNSDSGLNANDDSPLVIVRYNDAYANGSDGFNNYAGRADSHEGQDGNLTSDPRFYVLSLGGDAELDDFRLSSGSPCRDAGDPAILDPDGSRSDMGAFGGPWGNDWADLPMDLGL